jgi:hypothetical protein
MTRAHMLAIVVQHNIPGGFFAFLHQVALDESAKFDAAKAQKARDSTALNKMMTKASSAEPGHTTEHAEVTLPSLSTAVRSLFSRLVGKGSSAVAGSGAASAAIAASGATSSANRQIRSRVVKQTVWDASSIEESEEVKAGSVALNPFDSSAGAFPKMMKLRTNTEQAQTGRSIFSRKLKPESWKVRDVVAFLDTIDLGMHAEAFKTHSVNGKMLLTLDDKEMLKMLHIVDPLHRRKLLHEIARLRVASVAEQAQTGRSIFSRKLKPESWKVRDVVAFLDTIELGMHAEAFKASSVNGKMLLQLTDQDMLQTLNIVDLLHRRKLLKEIATLRKATLRVASL